MNEELEVGVRIPVSFILFIQDKSFKVVFMSCELQDFRLVCIQAHLCGWVLVLQRF